MDKQKHSEEKVNMEQYYIFLWIADHEIFIKKKKSRMKMSDNKYRNRLWMGDLQSILTIM